MIAPSARLRTAVASDGADLLRLWTALFEEQPGGDVGGWQAHAQEWFLASVDDPTCARFPVIEVGGAIAATAVGTLERGVPNPWCPRGRTVRLANVITLPEHRGRGHGTTLALDVVDWARTVRADRVDLSATVDGRRLYERLGFTPTSAQRMKLML